MVDLITPMPRDRFPSSGRTSLGGGNDLHAVEIEGLAWLVNAPTCRAVVIDERGYPVEMVAPDPRAFALHKAWLAGRADREPAKRRRDLGQARLVAALVTERLPNLSFDGSDLSALPAGLRRLAPDLLATSRRRDDGDPEPGW